MAYVYADMDALAEYHQSILQTLPILEGQIGCKDELIENTIKDLRIAIERAEEREKEMYTALCNAQSELREAEQSTREYNANLAEDQDAMETPAFYYEEVERYDEYHTAAQKHTLLCENTLENFEAYVRSYRQQQAAAIEHFKKLVAMNGKFFESYVKKLIEVKQVTNISGSSFSGNKSAPNQEASGDFGAASNSGDSIKAAGEQWSAALPKEQRIALSTYTGSAYHHINEVLRGITPSFQDGYKDMAIRIHQALAPCSIPCDCTVYRGASNAALGNLQNVPDNQLAGSFFSDNGFMSTSLNCEDALKGDINLVISVPAGAKGAYVGYLSQLGHSESEVLFDIGSVMQITKVERDERGKRVIYADMM